MKSLAILRHAKSDWGDPALDDFDRPLNERGRQAARRMGEEMRRRNMRFDAVLASPARRVRETLDLAAIVDAAFDETLYMAAPSALVAAIRALPDATADALLVGHNPGLQQLVLRLSASSPVRSRVVEKFPTAALAIMRLNVESWREVGAGSAELIDLLLPRELP